MVRTEIYLQVIKQSSRRCNQQVDSFRKFIRFSAPVRTPNHNAKRMLMVFQQLFGNTKDLQCKLSSRRYNDNTRS